MLSRRRKILTLLSKVFTNHFDPVDLSCESSGTHPGPRLVTHTGVPGSLLSDARPRY